MEIQTCPLCTSSIPTKAIYCPLCTKQIRCRNCRELLEANWRVCIQCGTMIGESTSPLFGQESASDTHAVNTIEYHETERKRSLKAQFTNTIGNSLTKTLNLILANRINPERTGERRAIRADVKADHVTQPLLPFGHSGPDEEVSHETTLDQHEKEELNTSAPQKPQSDLESLKKLFSQDGDKFVLLDDRLKASTKIDFVRRLTCLFLYFRKLEGHDKVLRSTLNALVKNTLWRNVSASDGNTRRWLARNTETVHYDEGYIGLSNPGQDCAVKVLKEIWDVNHGQSLKEQDRKTSHAPYAPSPPVQSKKIPSVREEKEREARSRSGSPSGRPGPSAIVNELIEKGFFKKPTTLGEIVSHCRTSLTYIYKTSDFTAPLTRYVRDEKLRRKKNDNGQYEYHE